MKFPWRRLGLASFALALVGLAVLHAYYPLPYIYAITARQGPDFADIHDFPARTIAASTTPSELPVALDPGVARILEQFPGVQPLEAFLERTETSAFLVVHEGRLVEERYLLGHDRDSLQNSFSVSKSIMSAVVGLAIRAGALQYDAPITRYIPELAERDRRFQDITAENLLDMRSGIRFSSRISFPFVNADNALIYFHPDLESIIVERTSIAAAPGEFQYNNYNPPLIGLILRRATGVPVAEYLQRELWQPLGAERPAGWTTDEKGFERMESGFHARARDLARFGQLYLDRGAVEGERVLAEDWVMETTRPQGPWELDRFDGRSWGYHAGWWIIPRSSGPPDFCAIGHFGQFVYVSPQHRAVFVRTGPGRGEFGDRDWTELFFFAAERL